MKEQKILLGIDVGTTNVKVAAINHAGEILGFSSKALDVVHPKPNWAEQDSCQWWQKTAECIRETLGEIPGTAAEIAGIAGSAQGTGATPVDSSGNPLRNSLIWMDRCAQEQCDRLAEYTEKVFEVSGNAIDPVYNTLEMIWLKEHEPGHRSPKFFKIIKPSSGNPPPESEEFVSSAVVF